jgi:hypothetical protein
MFFAVEPKIEWDEYGEVCTHPAYDTMSPALWLSNARCNGCPDATQIINPDDYKDATLLANRQARRNIIEDAEGDEDMEKADQEAAAETRPTKTITNEVTINVRTPTLSMAIYLSLLTVTHLFCDTDRCSHYPS